MRNCLFRVVIAVESNKPDAADAPRAAAGDGIEIAVLPTRYPQGAEKQLIYALLKKEVPHGKLPAAAGALVHNVATAVAIADALESGKPLTERVVTVTGAVAKPGNYRVLLGTLVSELIETAGGLLDDVERGADVVIARAGRPVARLVPVSVERPTRQPGALKGRIRIANDFDTPLPDDVLTALRDRD